MYAPGRRDVAALLRLATPIVAIQVGMMLMGVVDTIMVGQLSAEALAAVAIANIYFFAMLISVVLSWVAPMSYHPGAVLVRQLCEPIFGPFRKLVPPIGGLDISAIFAFIALGVVQRVIAILASASQLPPNLIMGIG